MEATSKTLLHTSRWTVFAITHELFGGPRGRTAGAQSVLHHDSRVGRVSLSSTPSCWTELYSRCGQGIAALANLALFSHWQLRYPRRFGAAIQSPFQNAVRWSSCKGSGTVADAAALLIDVARLERCAREWQPEFAARTDGVSSARTTTGTVLGATGRHHDYDISLSPRSDSWSFSYVTVSSNRVGQLSDFKTQRLGHPRFGPGLVGHSATPPTGEEGVAAFQAHTVGCSACAHQPCATPGAPVPQCIR
jgi:hypothetical protein